MSSIKLVNLSLLIEKSKDLLLKDNKNWLVIQGNWIKIKVETQQKKIWKKSFNNMKKVEAWRFLKKEWAKYERKLIKKRKLQK